MLKNSGQGSVGRFGAEAKLKLQDVLIAIYLVGVFLSSFVFDWRYIQEHGIKSWYLWSDLEVLVKSFLWPYFLFFG